MRHFQINERKTLQISQHPKGLRSLWVLWNIYFLQSKQRGSWIWVSCFTNKWNISHCGLLQEGWTQLFQGCLDVPILNLETSSGPKLYQSTILQEKLLSQWISFFSPKKTPSENGQLALPSLPCSMTVGDSLWVTEHHSQPRWPALTWISPRSRGS